MPHVRVTLRGMAGAVPAARAGAEGAGLVCLEAAVLAQQTHPRLLLHERGPDGYADLLSAELVPICEAFVDQPVWMRTLDFSERDLAGLRGAPPAASAQSELASRGLRRDLEWPEHHAAQWMAVQQVHAAGCTNLGVLLPMVHDAEQLRAAQWMRDGAGLGDRCGLGILVQTPAAALCIETFIEAGVDAVAFDTDELTRFTLGLDRHADRPDRRIRPLHPAVLRLVGGAAAVCAQADVETVVCGSGAADAAMAPQYATMGISAISCPPDALEAVQSACARTRFGTSPFKGWDNA